MPTKIVIIAVLIAVLLDYVVGTLRALYYLQMGDEANKSKWWTSRKMWEGIVHKATEVVLLFVAHGVDYAAPYFNLQLPICLMDFVAAFLIIMELGSVLENLRELNPGLSKPIDTIEHLTGSDKHE